MKTKLTKWLIVPLVIFLILPLAALAATDQAGKNIYLKAGETVDDNYVVFGNTVTIEGIVNGDVIAGGNTVYVRGKVAGDVLVFGNEVDIDSEVSGNVRAVGNQVKISNVIGKNVTVTGASVTIEPTTFIGWSLVAYGADVNIRGEIVGNTTAGGATIIYGADTQGNVTLTTSKNSNTGGEALTVLPEASIGKNFTYSAKKQLTLDKNVKVGGETIFKAFKEEPKKGIFEGTDLTYKLISLFGLLVVALVVISLAPKRVTAVVSGMEKRIGRNIGLGLVYFLVTPIICLILLITIIGIPLSLITLVIYLVGLYVSQVFAGIFLGQKILRLVKKDKNIQPPIFWSMVLGVVVFEVIVNIPYIGWIIWLVGACWALSAMVEVKKQILKA